MQTAAIVVHAALGWPAPTLPPVEAVKAAKQRALLRAAEAVG